MTKIRKSTQKECYYCKEAKPKAEMKQVIGEMRTLLGHTCAPCREQQYYTFVSDCLLDGSFNSDTRQWTTLPSALRDNQLTHRWIDCVDTFSKAEENYNSMPLIKALS